jgi:conjugative transfer region protein (TIGR03748 family)
MKPINLIILITATGLILNGCSWIQKSRVSETQNIEQAQPAPELPADDNAGKAAQNSLTNPAPYTKPTIIQTGRYSAISANPTPEQRQLLNVIIAVAIPNDFQTVGQAVHYLLKRSGYQLVGPEQLPQEAVQLFTRPIPEIHRQLGPMTLRDALNVLTTPAFVLVEDPVQRLISYQKVAVLP